MKVAVIINELNIRGGTHKQVLRFCDYLKRMGNKVTIYTRYYDKDLTYPEFNEFEIVQIGKNGLFSPKEDRSFSQKARDLSRDIKLQKEFAKKISKDTDIINYHDNGMPWTVYEAKKLLHCPVVWQINDMPGCFAVGNMKGRSTGKIGSIKRFAYQHFVKHVDEITVNVSKNADLVKEIFNRDAKVLYCGVDVNEKLRKHSFKDIEGKIRLLSTGVFFTYRNYETLVDCVEKLKSEGKNVHLDIIGNTTWDKEYSDSIKKRISDKKLDDEVTVWGQVDDDKYNELYSSANIFLFMNVNQSWGLAIFEAMSCGLPVMVSNSVGAIELLHNGKDSVILDPFDVEGICKEIKKLTSDEDYYNRLSRKAMDEVKEYTWDKLYSSKMLNIFKQLESK